MMLRNTGYSQEAIGIFYYVAAIIAQNDNWKGTHINELTVLLDRFFLRTNNVGDQIPPYTGDVRSTGEFQKVRAYLCSIAGVLGIDSRYEVSIDKCSALSGGVSVFGSSTSTVPPVPTQSGTSSCVAQGYDKDIGEPWLYKCLTTNGYASSCRKDNGNIQHQSFKVPNGNNLYSECGFT